jgi:hypothetical protein
MFSLSPLPALSPDSERQHLQEKGSIQMLMGQNIWLVLIIVFIILVILGVISVAA